jgi:hypothetical protein
MNWIDVAWILPIVSHKSTKKFSYLLSLFKTLLIVAPKKYHQSLQKNPDFFDKEFQ